MKRLTITIDITGSDLTGENGNDPTYALWTALNGVTDKIGSGYTSGVARDANGNTVGRFEIAEVRA